MPFFFLMQQQEHDRPTSSTILHIEASEALLVPVLYIISFSSSDGHVNVNDDAKYNKPQYNVLPLNVDRCLATISSVRSTISS